MVATAIVGLLLVADTSDSRRRYLLWREGHGAEVDAYARFLAANGVATVVPMPELLRTGRSWRRCGAEFAVPPAASWPAMVPTLRLLADLKARGELAGTVHVDSAWRDPAFNACAGGAPRSKHLGNGAIDLEWDAPPGAIDRLCRAWGSPSSTIRSARRHWREAQAVSRLKPRPRITLPVSATSLMDTSTLP